MIPTVFALVTVVLGQFTILADPVCSKTDAESSSNSGCQFLSAAVASAYLEIIVFSWIFMGTTITMTLPGGKTYKILKPFSKLRTITGCYAFVFLVSLGSFSYGTTFLLDVAAQKDSGALLINFSLFLQIAYWLMVVLGTAALIMIKLNTKKGGKGGQYKPERTVRQKEKQLEQGSEAWFKNWFEVESDGMEMMESDKLEKFFTCVDLDVPADDIDNIVDQLDTEGTGEIGFTGAWSWYQSEGKGKYGVEKKEEKKGDDDDEDAAT
ncbi:hypothetical protein TrRE_jg11131 [Triparma retinervis]|uniref:EF-hand domain-containing protein n=1 Tax=Triparma retinervis TaxID=2557542 RepID=A0A9W7E7E3_9STRA|nr:hypothetical protein TrRE_jg11131 [Triparma retinervis]